MELFKCNGGDGHGWTRLNGNEVRLEYAQGIGGVGANTSARVVTIEDVRAIQIYYGGPWRTYTWGTRLRTIQGVVFVKLARSVPGFSYST